MIAYHTLQRFYAISAFFIEKKDGDAKLIHYFVVRDDNLLKNSINENQLSLVIKLVTTNHIGNKNGKYICKVMIINNP